MVVLYVVGAVFALFSFLSVLPLSITFRVGTAQKFDVSVRFCGVPINTKSEKRLAQQEESQQDGEGKEKSSSFSVSGGLEAVLSAVDRLFKLVRRCRVTRCEVHSLSVGDDAAVHYGEVCAIVYPFVGYLQTRRRLRKRNTHMDIGWDYDATDAVADITVTVRARLFFLATAVLPLLLQLKKRKGESV